ncbi:MAG: DUF1570 domain-containing protein [Planctomycetaceae bacterium]|nr:DUF1570 domain-containing protein [Planctomycetaceae bacterium]MBN8600741.1 DUF1570 domain-containing protein [Planctomycetota bacterium]
MFYQHPQRFDSIIGKFSRVSLWTLVWVISCLQVRATVAACQDETASTDKNVVVREVKFRDGEQLRQVLGEVLVEAVDGGILLQGTDGRQWAIQPEEIENSRDVSEPLKPMTNDEMEKAMLAELPGGFSALRTDHYLIMYNTTKAYSQWTGNLLERLYKAHFAFWKKKGVELVEPRFPLVAIIFDTKESYREYASKELGDSVDAIIGYYHLQSNRITMFDLTGVEGLLPNNAKVSRNVLLNEVLRQPGAERTVATIVHEAFHQLAYNTGLQVRLADNPFWVSEGMAVYFESPDFSSSQGWSTIGKVNQYNLREFSNYLRQRPADSLVTLLSDDQRFRNPATSTAAYAEAWALNYYLLRRRSKEYAEYLTFLAAKPPLGQSDPKVRIEEFKKYFGADLQKFDQQFLNYITTQVR